jgi:uncharacterized protein YkwD
VVGKQLAVGGAVLALAGAAGAAQPATSRSTAAASGDVRGMQITFKAAPPTLTSVFGAWHRTAPRGTRKTSARSRLEAQVLGQINSLRAGRNLRPLRFSKRLNAAADAHSQAMARRGFFAHDSADGTTFWKRVQRYYPQGRYRLWAVGENLLWSSPSVDPGGAMRMWMGSPPHRANLLTSRWREIGLSAVHVTAAPGVYGGREVTIVTADFGVRR